MRKYIVIIMQVWNHTRLDAHVLVTWYLFRWPGTKKYRGCFSSLFTYFTGLIPTSQAFTGQHKTQTFLVPWHRLRTFNTHVLHILVSNAQVWNHKTLNADIFVSWYLLRRYGTKHISRYLLCRP